MFCYTGISVSATNFSCSNDNQNGNKRKTCPTCKYGKKDAAGLFHFKDGHYMCCSSRNFNMTSKNGILFCDIWTEISKPIELKPCPMCGGHAVMNHHYDGMDLYGVICTRRGSVYCPGNTNAANNIEEAARLWNERPE